MTINQLHQKFTQGLKWNALFYTIRKSMSTILTILLFKKLSTQNFSIWANIYSTIFLTLLWLDFGFKKSLPRYCPEFAQDNRIMKIFIKRILFFQIAALILFTPLFVFISTYITHTYNIIEKREIFYLGCLLFVAEGIISVIRLIYHSYFWQKQFNSFMSVIVILKTLTIFFFVFAKINSEELLKIIFTTEILATFVAIILSLIIIKRLFKSKNDSNNQNINSKKIKTRKNLGKDFVLHSTIMWFNDNLKSLSERNFMTLFFTHLLGPFQANLFKLANDCALLFQRIVVKTIGTTDTSLLSYIEISENNKIFILHAFETLIKKISFLFILLIGILLPLLLHFGTIFKNQFIGTLFFLLITCYLIETILNPYERLLEVKRKYMMLLVSYIPYMLTLLFIFFFNVTLLSKSIIFFILLIYISRISSYLIMLYLTKKNYGITFPIKSIIKMLLFPLILFPLIYIPLKYLL